MRRDFTETSIYGFKIKNGGLISALIRSDLGRNGTPLLSGIDSGRAGPIMNSIAVEAFGRHLKGADASVPFSFGSFFGNS